MGYYDRVMKLTVLFASEPGDLLNLQPHVDASFLAEIS
jgi:hypothetical protein